MSIDAETEGNSKISSLVDLLKITAIPPPSSSRSTDQCYWGESISGKLTVSSAYNLIKGRGKALSLRPWLLVWRWVGPDRVKFFLWLVLHNALLTNSERFRQHMCDTKL
ncbi:hypothetical protein Scep_023045 [Stephania cephalantha]|uniref:Reverse transcriptase zinc-binding domain-containing protein n=1 Tax=Stephania cephalantha TaxID=152367 RepID=A0AAP0I2L9_9MAGN